MVITLANGTSFNASLGNAAHPEWLEVRVASGGVTLNGNVACHGSIVAPNGTVIVNGSTRLAGHVVADRFTINGNGVLTNPADQTAPTVAITSPADGATVTDTIEVLATASDNAAVAAVQFKLDGAPLGLEDTTAPFGVEWSTILAAPGSHTLTALARDFEGNMTTSAEVSVIVADQTPPTVAVSVPTNGAMLSGAVNLDATAEDDVAVVGVQFQLDGANFGDELLAAPYSLVWNTAAAVPGSHTLTAIARDAAGHVTTSEEVVVTVTDQAAPTIALSSPVDGASVGGVVTVVADTSDNVGLAGVQFKLNGANLGAEVTAEPFAIAWNTASYPEQSYTLTAVARDAGGNMTTSAPVMVSVRNVVFDTFENGEETAWTVDGGVWNVVDETGTHTWRQSDRNSVAYRAVRNGTDWTDQVVEADVRLFGANGSNRFFGVMARHQPTPDDYYYLILRTSNRIELKKLENNISANLTTAVPFTVEANKTYRLRLEVIGSTLKGYVNGQLKIQAADTTFTSGTGGLVTFFTDVSFDDVYMDPTPLNPVLAADDFESGGAGAWTAEAGAWSVATAGTQVYRQSDSAAPLARATIGESTWSDVLLEVDLRAQAFGASGAWAGALFRYVDADHHYAVALRDGTTIELRRVEGGVTTTLASAPAAVAPGALCALRIDAVGNSIKVYRDGALALQATDDTFAAGKVALAAASAAADFDDVLVTAP